MQQSIMEETIGQLAERLIGQSWLVWCKQHKPGKARELAWSDDVLRVNLRLGFLHYGRMQAHVEVEAKKSWERETYVYLFEESGQGLFRQVAQA